MIFSLVSNINNYMMKTKKTSSILSPHQQNEQILQVITGKLAPEFMAIFELIGSANERLFKVFIIHLICSSYTVFTSVLLKSCYIIIAEAVISPLF